MWAKKTPIAPKIQAIATKVGYLSEQDGKTPCTLVAGHGGREGWGGGGV